AGPGVAIPCDPPGRDGHREQVGVERVVELVPVERRGHLRPGPGPDAPGAEHRLVGGVLVEVDEDPLSPLLLPPGRSDEVGAAALELPGEGDGGGPDPVAAPATSDAQAAG